MLQLWCQIIILVSKFNAYYKQIVDVLKSNHACEYRYVAYYLKKSNVNLLMW